MDIMNVDPAIERVDVIYYMNKMVSPSFYVKSKAGELIEVNI